MAVLFGMFAKDLRLNISGAQYAFPDCQITVAGRTVGVELEFRSKSFSTHIKKKQWPAIGCELIVCWEHNWPSVPVGLTVLEMRKMFGFGGAVWMLPMYSEYADELPRGRKISDGWSVPSRCGINDVLVVYRPGVFEVRDLLRVRSPVERVAAGWRPGLDWMASVQRIAELDAPVTLDDLTSCGVKRQSLQGRPEITAVWPALRKLVLSRNPGLRATLDELAPPVTSRAQS